MTYRVNLIFVEESIVSHGKNVARFVEDRLNSNSLSWSDEMLLSTAVECIERLTFSTFLEVGNQSKNLRLI